MQIYGKKLVRPFHFDPHHQLKASLGFSFQKRMKNSEENTISYFYEQERLHLKFRFPS